MPTIDKWALARRGKSCGRQRPGQLQLPAETRQVFWPCQPPSHVSRPNNIQETTSTLVSPPLPCTTRSKIRRWSSTLPNPCLPAGCWGVGRARVLKGGGGRQLSRGSSIPPPTSSHSSFGTTSDTTSTATDTTRQCWPQLIWEIEASSLTENFVETSFESGTI